jgi:hypothetical protein
MTTVRFIYTDRPISRTEYSPADIFGGGPEEIFLKPDGSPRMAVRLKEPSESDEKAAGHLFPGLMIYKVNTVISFTYNTKCQSDNMNERGRIGLNWLLDLAREHLKNGAKKCYYGVLSDSWSPDQKKPKMKKLDLAKFKPKDRKFVFGDYVIWQFIDSSIRP